MCKNHRISISIPRTLHHLPFVLHQRCHAPAAEPFHLVAEPVIEQYTRLLLQTILLASLAIK